jgi:hypothetical protein
MSGIDQKEAIMSKEENTLHAGSSPVVRANFCEHQRRL